MQGQVSGSKPAGELGVTVQPECPPSDQKLKMSAWMAQRGCAMNIVRCKLCKGHFSRS